MYKKKLFTKYIILSFLVFSLPLPEFTSHEEDLTNQLFTQGGDYTFKTPAAAIQLCNVT